jgi:hypothetical protein
MQSLKPKAIFPDISLSKSNVSQRNFYPDGRGLGISQNRVFGKVHPHYLRLDIGEPLHPVQPTTVPLVIIKEITSQLSSFGIEVLDRGFITGTLEFCAASIASVYDEVVFGPSEISSDSAMQLIADITFLELAFSNLEGDVLKRSREELITKVLYSWV